jgi:uncharacterized protein (TIGR02266 family)
MSYSSLLEAFEALNSRKLDDPHGLTVDEQLQWKDLRRRIEEVLFQQKAQPGADRREHLRVPVSLSVRYWTSSEFKDRYIPVLGEGGIFIPTGDPLPVGETFDLEIELASEDTSLELRGQVAWVNRRDGEQRGMGVKFVELSYIQKSFLYDLVSDMVRARMLERRQTTRADTRLPVEFSHAEGSYELITSDLSASGLFVVTDHLHSDGDQVKLRIELPGYSDPVGTIARVVRVVEESQPGLPAGVGLEFVSVDEQGRDAVLDHLISQVDQTQGAVPGRDLRRHTRIKRRIPVTFAGADCQGTSFCRDISAGGVFIQAHEPLPLRSRIMVDIEHPLTAQHLRLAGRVVQRVHPDLGCPHQVPGFGVEFTDLEADTDALLREFLREFLLLESTSAAPLTDFLPA